MRLALLAATAISTFTALPASSQTADKWGAHLDLEGKLGTERNLGEGGLFLPLMQTDRTLTFGDLRMRFDDNDSHEANVGVGVRHMLESGWNIGGYGYFDRRGSTYGNYFNQLTFGAEALGRDFDLRANSYWAIGSRERAADSLSTAELSGTSITVRGGEEHSMSGFDVEAGWRLPIFDAEAPRQLRLYAGGYRFTADGVEDVTGPRLRADMSFEDLPLPWPGAKLNLGAEWQHDDPRGSQAFIGLRLRIPLQSEAPASRLTAQERRMTDTVIRDIDVVTQAGAFGAPEAATRTASGQTLTVLNSATTTGAALPGAVAAAGANSTVILSGSFNTTATTTLQSGQTVIAGGATSVRTASGKTANVILSNATIAGATGGGSNNPTIDMANNSTLTGGVISNNSSSGLASVGVRAFNVTGVTVANSTISGTESGANTAIGLLFLDSSGTISGNSLSANSAPGNLAISIDLVNSTITVTNNSFTASGGNLTRNIFLNGVAINAGSTGNTLVNGGCHNNSSATGAIGLVGGGTCP